MWFALASLLSIALSILASDEMVQSSDVLLSVQSCKWWCDVFPRCRLVEDLRLLSSSGLLLEHQSLQGSPWVITKCSIVSEDEVPDQLLHGLWVALQSPEVELSRWQWIDSVFILKAFCGLLEHQAEENGDESWSQNATLFYSTGNWEGLWEVAAKSDLTVCLHACDAK